jgi:manganese/zinc/iron transport system permease protein
MTWTHSIDTWIVVTGALCALPCGLLGTFLVLRRMSMMGDAISHAVLPGLAVAFLVTGTRSSWAMFAGAAAAGLLTALFVQWVQASGGVERGAAMGVVFTALFAVGLIIIVRGAARVDLDPGCVLYGAIELGPLDLVNVAGLRIPRPVLVLGAVFLVDALVVGLLYKELAITSFDPQLATTLGISAAAMHYLLMTLVAVTTVACFESIGSILVIAMLIVPPAAAHLLTDRLGRMIVLSMAIGAASSLLGHWGAITIPPWFGFEDTGTAGMMAVAAGGIFAMAVLFAPRHGVLSRTLERAALRRRILREDVLGMLYRLEERGVDEGFGAFVGHLRGALRVGPLGPRLAIAALRRAGLLRVTPQGCRLSDEGRRRAADLVRSHRLWESYLVRHLGLAPDHVHETAMRLEHVTDEPMQEGLAAGLDDATTDPHGRAIPAEG